MKNLKLFVLMLFALTLFSCDKNDDITVTINESGSLQIKIIDDNKSPVSNAVITLTELNTNSIIVKEETAIDGIFELEKILQGSYKCFIRAEKEGKIYTNTSYFQIFSDNKKIVEYNPFSNTGTVLATININGAVKDITKYIVAVVPGQYYNSDINTIKKYAYFSAPLNENGEVSISGIPADNQYTLCVYKNNDIYKTTSFVMEKKEINIPIYIEVGTVNIEVQGEIAKYSDYEILITSYLNNTTDINILRERTLYSSKLESKEKTTFTELLIPNDYYAYLIKGDKVYDASNFYFNSSSSKDIVLKVGSISVKVESSVSDIQNYYIALSSNHASDISTLKKQAFADGKLDSNGNIKFSELPTIQNYKNSFLMSLYKDNTIYNQTYWYWDNLNQSSNTYL